MKDSCECSDITKDHMVWAIIQKYVAMKPSVMSQIIYRYADWVGKRYTSSKKPSTIPALVLITFTFNVILSLTGKWHIT